MNTLHLVICKYLPIEFKRLAGFVLVSFFLIPPLAAQEVIFSRLTIDDGLSSNFVHCVWQSKNGYLWVGTENGLQRYDGNAFISANRDYKKNSLPAFPVRQILESKKGVVWLRLGNYFGKFDTGRMSFIKADIAYPKGAESSEPGRLTEDIKGNILLIVPGKDILAYNPKHNSFEHDPSVVSVPDDFGISDVAADPVTRLYYLCGSAGFAIYDPVKRVFYNAGYNPLRVPFLEKTKGLKSFSSIYLSKQEGIWLVKQQKFSVKVFLYDFKSERLRPKSIVRDLSSSDFTLKGFAAAGKRTWIYGAGLLNFYDNTYHNFVMAGHNFMDYYGIQYNSVHQVYEDRDRNVWIASDNGLYKGRL